MHNYLKTNTNYYPFGSLMPNRYFSSATYRYGFNGMEKDDEMKGSTGSSYTTYFRQYDPRLGRFMSMDPVNYPWQSDYAAFNNNPIYFADPSGDEGEEKGKGNKKNNGGDKKSKKTGNDDKWQKKDKDGKYTGEVADAFDLEDFTVSAKTAVGKILAKIGGFFKRGWNNVKGIFTKDNLKDANSFANNTAGIVEEAAKVMKNNKIKTKAGTFSTATDVLEISIDVYDYNKGNIDKKELVENTAGNVVEMAHPLMFMLVENGKDPNGLTNLNSGRLADAYSVNYRQYHTMTKIWTHMRAYPEYKGPKFSDGVPMGVESLQNSIDWQTGFKRTIRSVFYTEDEMKQRDSIIIMHIDEFFGD